ncbi:unnamed protein product [Somion occarium]|uniref:Uncharacterized protein n=1 Tax=Somion occarium TaxID=3059160 RepID=A0ABP1DR21_9APHY
MTGYFAFPPPSAPGSSTTSARTPFAAAGNTTIPTQQAKSDADSSSKLDDEAWAERLRLQEERRQKRLAYEQEQIRRAELDWVRAGGVLRNAQGRRDKARTELYRAEIRVLDEERAILDRWNVYEDRCRKLSTSDDYVTWSDIPWPVQQPPMNIEDFTSTAIADFLFAPLRVRGASGTRKDKLRQALLRWHPDKLSAVLSKVDDADQGRVLEGIHAVFRCLRELQDLEKNS